LQYILLFIVGLRRSRKRRSIICCSTIGCKFSFKRGYVIDRYKYLLLVFKK